MNQKAILVAVVVALDTVILFLVLGIVMQINGKMELLGNQIQTSGMRYERNQMKAKENAVENPTNQPQTKPEQEEIKPLSTVGWKVYTNKEQGFQTKYPNDWYFDDYSEDFKRFVLGFYPNGKKQGVAYLGDVELESYKGEERNKVIAYLEEGKGTEKKTSLKNYSMLVNPDFPGMISQYVVTVDCGTFVHRFSSPSGAEKEVLMQMANELNCL